MSAELIKIGQYIVLQKQDYQKLHKLNKPDSKVNLGQDSVILSGVDGCPYFSIFKMIPNSKRRREYTLELTQELVELKDEIDIGISGTDNRNIVDDGRSQKLTFTEIEKLAQDSNNKASNIVESLITNSKTFHNKTEFSQAKYLKKKEKKYSEYVQILKPNLRIIAEVLYRLDPSKVQSLRIDTLSQIITLSNIHCEGNHLLYDSGSNGLVAAALLSAVGAKTNGKVVHMHPGNMSQKQALLAMNFDEEQYSRCISVNIYSVLRQYYQGNTFHSKTNTEDLDKNIVITNNSMESIDKTTEDANSNITESIISEDIKLKRKADVDGLDNNHKSKVPKHDNHEETSNEHTNENDDTSKSTEPKKPKWYYDNITASEILQEKMDSLVIIAKEDPENIFLELMPFIKPGRPFVIYYTVSEPLQSLYTVLKSNSKVAALKLTCNFIRNYQVLPERTHPEVTMNGQSGFLLTGYVLK